MLPAVIQTILAVFLPPVYDGFRRKAVARIQNRIGPPILQTWYDIIKLVRKETIIPRPYGKISLCLLTGSLLTSLLAFFMIPLFSSSSWNVILFAHLLVLSTFMLALSGAIVRNPYSVTGASREAILFSLIEPALVISVLAIATSRGSVMLANMAKVQPSIKEIPAIIALLLCAIAESGRVPFDIMEAEQELSGGPLIDFSGKALALAKVAFLTRQFTLLAFISEIILPTPALEELLRLLAFLFKMLGLYMVIVLAESLNARFRIYELEKFFIVVLLVSLIGIVGVSL